VKRVAIVILVCGLAAAGSFAGYKYHERISIAFDDVSTLVTELPAGAPVVVYVDAKAFRESSLYKKTMLNSPPPAPSGDYADFMNKTGFDFARDLDRVAIAIESAQHGSKMTAIAEGRFDQTRIAAYAALKGKSSVRGGQTYYEFAEPKDNRTVEMTFLSPNRLRISSIELRTATGDHADAAPANSGNASDGISRVSGSPLFAIADVRSWSEKADMGSYTEMIRSVRRFTLTASPDGDTLRVALEAECVTPEGAQQLGATANVAKMMAPALLNSSTKSKDSGTSAATVNQFMNSIQITEDGVHVKLAFSITSDMLNLASHSGTAKPPADPKP
jgi:hypothetical protein